MKRISITVSGKVQGVFYRANTEKKAKEIGVSGFVRNEPNGDVYIEAQGTETQLEQLKDWCKKGPERAVINHMHSSPMELKEETGFYIIR
jgi:acylphosphatase